VGLSHGDGDVPGSRENPEEVVSPAADQRRDRVDVEVERTGCSSTYLRANVDLPTPGGPLRWIRIGMGEL
jgi:hypothetical protein